VLFNEKKIFSLLKKSHFLLVYCLILTLKVKMHFEKTEEARTGGEKQKPKKKLPNRHIFGRTKFVLEVFFLLLCSLFIFWFSFFGIFLRVCIRLQKINLSVDAGKIKKSMECFRKIHFSNFFPPFSVST
jgi:hypothetical protein